MSFMAKQIIGMINYIFKYILTVKCVGGTTYAMLRAFLTYQNDRQVMIFYLLYVTVVGATHRD